MQGQSELSTTQGPRAWSGVVAPGIQVSVGEIQFAAESRPTEDLAAGLKLAVLLDGAFQLGVSGHTPQTVRGSSASLFLANDLWQLDHLFEAGTRIRYLTLHLDSAVLEEELEASVGANSNMYGPVAMFSATTPLAMTAIAHQMMICPYSGTARRLHLAGKGLELTALALDRFLCGANATQTPLATPMEVRRLEETRDWLSMNFHDPPDLPQLARRAGLNVRKLTAGFRRLFGMSVAEYLRDVRMKEAYRLLSQGCSVTLTAEHVGYTLPHFTMAFRRQYGVNPGTLVWRDSARSPKN
jgi:AraC family transcriptional activator of pyochelin receptor